MEVLNKFRSTVSSTVSQLSGVLPGNPVTREYEVSNHIASAGPGLSWKIYQGFKKSTKQEAAIFVFEKRQLDRWPRGDRDVILETLKRGISQITRIRHPQILTVQHPLEESRESLAFATEPVFASLANIMGKTENMPSPLPSTLKNYSLFEIEIKYGLLQIGEGLAFLHNDVKLLHRNLCLESIVVNHQGAWKIFGFDFCVLNQEMQDGKPFWPFTEYNPSMNPLAQPTLDFLAPECALTMTHSPASDMFSLGMVIYALHNSGQPVYSCGGDWNSFKRHVKEMKQVPSNKLECVPEGLRDIVKLMLNGTPEVRADAHQFIKISYFEDVCVKTLNYLDSLFQWDNLQKSQLYKGLPEIMKKLPHRVCINRVLPCLAKEFVNHTMVPFVLPNVLLMAENSSNEEYIEKILPVLKPVMKIQEPVQVLLIFMQRMELLLKLTPADQVRSDVLPMLFRALESDAQQIQELCLTVLPTFAGLIDYPAMKNALLPRIKKLCINTTFLSVRVNCLVCLGKLLEHLDKWLVLDEVLPFLPQIPSREPAVIMGILGIYKLALTHKKLGITKEVMATKILPFLMPLCIENGLTMAQFNALTTLVKDMFQRVETEHRAKLDQLNSMQQQTNAVNTELVSGQSLISAPPPKTDIDDMFSSLGISSLSSPTDKLINNSNVTSPTSGFSLSIQEKQRLANEQETKRRLQTQSQSTIIPTKTNPVSRPEARDLTTTLMENNLNQISHVTPALPAPVFPVQQHSFPARVRPAGTPGMVTSPTGFSAFQNTPALGWPNNSTPQWNASNFNSNSMAMNSQTGWSSTMTSPPSTPMNNMFRSPSTHLSSTATQPTQAKSLSNADINDLLS